jgi:hypothetical protein
VSDEYAALLLDCTLDLCEGRGGTQFTCFTGTKVPILTLQPAGLDLDASDRDTPPSDLLFGDFFALNAKRIRSCLPPEALAFFRRDTKKTKKQKRVMKEE